MDSGILSSLRDMARLVGGVPVIRSPELTEKLERELFSGGVNVSARERNFKRHKFFYLHEERRLVVCDNAWRLLQQFREAEGGQSRG